MLSNIKIIEKLYQKVGMCEELVYHAYFVAGLNTQWASVLNGCLNSLAPGEFLWNFP